MNSNFESSDIDWAAVEREWQRETELDQPLPRRVVSCAPKTGCGARVGGAFLGCALTGMFVLGFFLSLWAGLAVLILPFGSTTEATITQHELTRGRSPRYGDSESYLLTFQFRPNGSNTIYSGEWPVNGATFLRLRDGDKTKARYFALFPGVRPMLEEGISPWLHILFMGPMGLLMLVIGGVPLLGLLPQSRAGKRLVRRGLAAPALVVDDKNGRLTFWFRVTGARGETQTIETTQSRNNQVRSFDVGAVVTVLFEARRPQRAAIYHLCGWRAREIGET